MKSQIQSIMVIYFLIGFIRPQEQESIWRNLISRNQWGANVPLGPNKPLNHPVPYVIISHTVTKFCTTKIECSSIVKSIQSFHINNQFNDIGYNFLVGGDGNVYIGRGWDEQNFHKHHKEDSIGISVIGNFIQDDLSNFMQGAIKILLEEGVVSGKLTKDYKVVGHNQTRATLSPGVNVVKVIKRWPHFYPNLI